MREKIQVRRGVLKDTWLGLLKGELAEQGWWSAVDILAGP